MTPVFCGSGAKNIGVGPLLDAVATFLPAPNERPPVEWQNPATGEPVSVPPIRLRRSPRWSSRR